MEGWDVYRELFDELLEGAEEDSTSSQPRLFVLPEWAFDILNEFVYQFQGFCQFRTSLYASAKKYGLLTPEEEPASGNDADGQDGAPDHEKNKKKGPPHHVVENLAVMREDSAEDVWNIETVQYYLNRLVQIGTSEKCTVPAYQYFGIFASVALSRLECLLCDYSGCLAALSPVLENPSCKVVKSDLDSKDFGQVVSDVIPARLSMAYHAGVAFLMLRRYKDAVTTVGDLCSFLNRGFKTGQLRHLPTSEQLYKNYERLLALLAICVGVCPQPNLIDDYLQKMIREKYGPQLSKESYGELFVSCAPKFVSPYIPDFNSNAMPVENFYKQQVYLLEQELKDQAKYRNLRSYLKLYTSIPTSKLVKFGNEESTLCSLKHKMRQMESDNPSVPSLTQAGMKSALDIHYYVEKSGDQDIVHVDEAEKERRFEKYFFGQINQSNRIQKGVCRINTNV
jgi:translation initiation factor 3 subunit L